jgi:hypothetical protein
MKKYTLGLILAVCFYASQAQISYGVKGGVNVNDISFAGFPSEIKVHNETNLGIHFGIYGTLPISSKLQLITEIQFTQRGIKTVITEPFRYTANQTDLYYIEIPISLSYSVIKKLAVDLGVNSSYRLNRLSNDKWNIFDFGLVGGLRLSILPKLTLVGKYNYSFVPVGDYHVSFFDSNQNYFVSGTAEIYNRNIQIGLCYQIR